MECLIVKYHEFVCMDISGLECCPTIAVNARGSLNTLFMRSTNIRMHINVFWTENEPFPVLALIVRSQALTCA